MMKFTEQNVDPKIYKKLLKLDSRMYNKKISKTLFSLTWLRV